MLFIIQNRLYANVQIVEHVSIRDRGISYIGIPDPLFELSEIDLPHFPIFTLPVDGRITSLFGWRRHPLERKKRFHNGIDIASAHGSEVVSAYDGEIRYAGWGDACGMVVVIDHGLGLASRYCHLSKILVFNQERVKRGEAIGEVGDTGRVTGSHLHFELLVAGEAIDPAEMLGF